MQIFDASVAKTSSALCIGLDPPIPEKKLSANSRANRPKRIRPLLSTSLKGITGVPPKKEDRRHIKQIIRATSPHAAAFKINLAFYLARGSKGIDLMRRIRDWTPETPLILDGKFNDIENTLSGYAEFAANIGVDAVTVSPYMGCDFSPFLNRGIAVFVLATTTNQPEIQSLQITADAGTLARHVALKVGEHPENQGLVVGSDAALIRELCPDSWFLSPGLGAQGKRPEDILKGLRRDGRGLLVNASRSIWTSTDPEKTAREMSAMLRVAPAATL